MTKKILNIHHNGVRFECIYDDNRRNPYRVYRVWTGHRRKIAEYGDFLSVLFFLKDLYLAGADVTVHETLEWAREYKRFI